MFDDVNLMRWMLGVVALVMMFGSLVVIIKKMQMSGHMTPKKTGRLKVGEKLMLDGRRKLLLIEHDDQEHLILLGHQTETLISSGKRKKNKPAPKTIKSTTATIKEKAESA